MDWNLTINFGIKTGFNDAFIIDENTKNRLIEEDPKSAEVIRPILRGKDIKKYNIEYKKLYILNIHNGNRINNTNPINIDNYPAIKNHLNKYYTEILKRYDKGITPYNLRNCIYMDDFYKQKIVYPCIMAQEPCFAYDDKQFFTIAPGNIISGKHLKYLCCLLNSDLLYFALRKYYMGGGIEGELKTNRLLVLPVKSPTNEEEEYIESIFNKNLLPNREQEKQINDFVYDIYGIDEKEQQFIVQYKKGD